MKCENGIAFEKNVLEEIRNEFYFLNSDIDGKKRLFFDNSGGSLRLKTAVEAKTMVEMLPDCPERSHTRALQLNRSAAYSRRPSVC
jgi:hypothetical protein